MSDFCGDTEKVKGLDSVDSLDISLYYLASFGIINPSLSGKFTGLF